jgi:hypothetical protein
MFDGFKPLHGRFIACSRVTKRPIFVFMSTTIWPGDVVECFLQDDDYSFGILQSNAHWQWFIAKCSKLTERFHYTSDTVLDTFPWPQFEESREAREGSEGKAKPSRPSRDTIGKIDAVAAAARELRRVRAEALPKLKGGLRALYRTLELPGANPLKDAHAVLDAAVLTAYGFSAKKDLLAQLIALKQAVAANIENASPVTAPGVPEHYPVAKKLVTEDCIRPTTI